jgi:hypothetical protein
MQNLKSVFCSKDEPAVPAAFFAWSINKKLPIRRKANFYFHKGS